MVQRVMAAPGNVAALSVASEFHGTIAMKFVCENFKTIFIS